MAKMSRKRVVSLSQKQGGFSIPKIEGLAVPKTVSKSELVSNLVALVGLKMVTKCNQGSPSRIGENLA